MCGIVCEIYIFILYFEGLGYIQKYIWGFQKNILIIYLQQNSDYLCQFL